MNDGDMIRYLNGLREDKFKDNKELTGLLNKHGFITGSGISPIKYGLQNSVEFKGFNQFEVLN